MTSTVKVGKWDYDSQSGELSYKDQKVRLPNQQHTLLSLLVQNGRDSLTSRETIIAKLWPEGRVVEYDQSLNACMRKLRKALEDDSQNPQYIETIAGKGYRLVANVSPVVQSNHKLRYRVMGVSFLCVMLFLGLLKSKYVTDTETPVPTLAVMPFMYLQNEGRVTQTNSSVVALREELLAQLSRVSIDELIVLAPGSADKLAESEHIKSAPMFQLTGTMRQTPLNLRVDMRLTNQEQQLVWSESFVLSNGSGILAFQSMARDIILSVSSSLMVTPISIVKPHVVLAANDMLNYNDALYLASQGFAEQSRQAMDKFEQILDVYPDYVPVMVQLAKLHNSLAANGPLNQAKHFQKAASYALEAITHDKESAEAYFVLAYVQLYHDWNFKESRFSLDKGLSIAPNNGFARSLNAAWFASQERMDEALNEAMLAKRLDPLSQTVNADLCWYFNFAEQYERAERECASILTIEPQSTWTRLGLVEAYLQQGKSELALTQYARLFNIQKLPEDESSEAVMTKIVQQWLTQILDAYEQGQIQAYMVAALYSQLEEDANATKWLQKAYDDGNSFLIFMRVDPRLESLRELHIFQTIEQKLFKNSEIIE